MVGVDGGGRVDLEAVVVLASIFEKAVHGVQNLVGQQEKPFPAEREDTPSHAQDGEPALKASGKQKTGLSLVFIAIYNPVRQTNKKIN